MNPGDKYLIYGDQISTGANTLSDYGNVQHTHNSYPKFIKAHVVSIEDSGKITYLDSTTQWYKNSNKDSNKDNDYYIKNGQVTNQEDIDDYRSKL